MASQAMNLSALKLYGIDTFTSSDLTIVYNDRVMDKIGKI